MTLASTREDARGKGKSISPLQKVYNTIWCQSVQAHQPNSIYKYSATALPTNNQLLARARLEHRAVRQKGRISHLTHDEIIVKVDTVARKPSWRRKNRNVDEGVNGRNGACECSEERIADTKTGSGDVGWRGEREVDGVDEAVAERDILVWC